VGLNRHGLPLLENVFAEVFQVGISDARPVDKSLRALREPLIARSCREALRRFGPRLFSYPQFG
jgi:hypothetical protein